jgi:hypothetical protein
MTYRVRIYDIYEVFKRAHDCVVREIQRKRSLTWYRDCSAAKLVKTVWYELYGVCIVYENSRAQWLDFDDERHFTIFCLKA